MRAVSSALLVCWGLLVVEPALAQQRTWAPIAPGTTFTSGDSWITGGKRFKLYGARSCERGRIVTNASGVQRDCGEASLAMLVSLIRDLNPVCTEVALDEKSAISHVVCLALPDRGAGKGSRIDLGTALISSGFAFAARDSSGQSLHADYAIAESVAKQSKAGLWGLRLSPAATR